MIHMIEPFDFTVQDTEKLLVLADDISKNPKKYSKVCQGKILATCFYEPSTRTRLSFETAMINLGGNVLGFDCADNSSVSKGETVADTIRVISSYADICAIRHNKEGAPLVASRYSKIPIINAGDGTHQHPTQTLTDLMTIKAKKGRLSNLTIGLCGDLKFGRTVHSLIKSMSRYDNIKFVLISPEELKIPKYIIDNTLNIKNIAYEEARNLEDVIGKLDVLYMTRIQRERFSTKEEYLRLKDSYVLDMAKMNMAKNDMIVLHPLPRVNEISVCVDDDPRAVYFEQAKYGVFIRMALILTLLKSSKYSDVKQNSQNEVLLKDRKCTNKACITSIEEGIKHLVKVYDKDKYQCIYCEHEV